MHKRWTRVAYLLPLLILLSACSVGVSRTPAPIPVPTEAADFDDAVRISLNTVQFYWNKKFLVHASEGFPAPPIYSYENTGDLKCEKPVKENNAIFCSVDNYIAFDVSWTKEKYAKYGDEFVYFLFAHEYAHAVQFKVEQRFPSQKGFELQADCIAGAFLAENAQTFRIDINDLNGLYKIIYSLGDDADQDTDDDHGTGAERYASFHRGYTYGLGSCGLNKFS